MQGNLIELVNFHNIFPLMVNFVGESGSGKSFLANNVTTQLLDSGMNVVQVNSGDYLRDKARLANFGPDVGAYMSGKSEKSLMKIDRSVDRSTKDLIKRVTRLGDISLVAPEAAMPTILLLTSRMGSAFSRRMKVRSLNVGVYCPPRVRAERAVSKKLLKLGEEISQTVKDRRVRSEKYQLIHRDNMDIQRLCKVYPWLHGSEQLYGIQANDVVIDSSKWRIQDEVNVVWALLQPMLNMIGHDN